jgi:predicted permease
MARLEFGRRLRSRFWRPAPREEVDSEIRFHLDMRARELEARGLPPAQAREEAARRFGDAAEIARACRVIAGRRNRAIDMAEYLADFVRDFRDAGRMMLRRPVFALTAILTLAVGIGANASFFSLVKAVLLNPLAAHEPERVIRLYWRGATGGANANFAYLDYAEIAAGAPSISPLSAVHLAPVAFSADDQRDQLLAEIASGGYFATRGLRAGSGRMLSVLDDRRGAAPTAVISHRYWQRRFGSDASVVGRSVLVNNRPYTIVGIADARAAGSFVGAPVDVWLALEPSLPLLGVQVATDRTQRVLTLIGRLAQDATDAQVRGELETVSRDITRARGRDRITLETGPGTLLHGGRRSMAVWFLGIVMGLVGLVLLVAAANVANLLLARTLERRRDAAVRMALGAGRGRLVRQAIAEVFALAACGGAAGLLLTEWITTAFGSVALLPGFELRLDLAPDVRVFAFTAVITLLTGFVAAVAPALSAGRGDVLPALKSASGTAAGREAGRLRSALVVAQVAVSVVLLVAAGLLVRSARAAAAIDLGFDRRGIVATDIDLEPHGYTEATGREFYRELVARAAAVPGVEAATLANRAPLDSSTPTLRISGGVGLQTGPSTATGLDVTYHVIGPGYFETVGIPIAAGRGFAAHDRETSPLVVIVNQTLAGLLAREHGVAGNLLGRRFELVAGTATERRRDIAGTAEIVGVASDAKYRTIGEAPQPHIYLPLEQHYGPGLTLLVRSRVEPAPTSAIHRAIGALDPDVQGFFTRTLDEHTRVALLPARLAANVSAMVGAIALALGAVGLYGVIACLVTERTRELGIRMALGASRRMISRQVLARAGVLASAGAAIGLVLAALAGRAVAGLLYGVSPVDPATFAGVTLVLGVVTIVAAWIPARRAARIDPIVALRGD